MGSFQSHAAEEKARFQLQLSLTWRGRRGKIKRWEKRGGQWDLRGYDATTTGFFSSTEVQQQENMGILEARVVSLS